MSVRFVRWSLFGAFLALMIGMTVTMREAANLQAELYTSLESRYGFTSEIVTSNVDENASKVLVIHPRRNGLFYQAGFRDGDQLPGSSKFKFYSLLQNNKGDSIAVDVVDKNGIAKTIIFNIPD